MERCVVLAALGVLALGVPRPAPAQWRLALEVGVARFGGTARDTTGATVRPYRPTNWALRLDRGIERIRLGLDVLYAKTGIAAERDGIAFVEYDAAWLVEVAPYFTTRVVALGEGVEVRLEFAPAFDIWGLSGEHHTRWAGRGAVALEWPLGRRFSGALRVVGALSSSIFDPEEFPEDVERQSTRRFGVALSLARRL
jgi:hypothetical protein